MDGVFLSYLEGGGYTKENLVLLGREYLNRVRMVGFKTFGMNLGEAIFSKQ